MSKRGDIIELQEWTSSLKHTPYKGQLPNFMKLVTPYTDFRSDKVRIVTPNGTYLSFFPSGKSA